MSMKRKKQIFTLVELLITIAIIAILAGMLLPALNSAREKAGTISCLARQKQVNLTLSMYADANDDYLPPRGGYGEYADIDWMDMLKNSINLETKNKDTFRCPALPPNNAHSNVNGLDRQSFGLNIWATGKDSIVEAVTAFVKRGGWGKNGKNLRATPRPVCF